ncbi:MAG: hypothetical protein QM764_10785, partial [Chitinophagaceae bacterium]
MSHFFTLLFQLIVTNINSRIVVPVKKVSAILFASDDTAEIGYPAAPQGGANDDLCVPPPVKKPVRQRRLRFSLFPTFQINLAPVAVTRPAYAHSTPSTTTTQTNRMKQVLRAAKGSALCFFILVASVFATKAYATATVSSPATNTTISADNALNAPSGGVYTTLPNFTLSEGANTDFPANTTVSFTLSAPSGWQFRTGITLTFTNTSTNGSISNASAVVTNSSTITVSFNTSSGTSSGIQTITIAGIQVRANDGANLALATITRATGGSTITGFAAGATAGQLQQVGGAPTSLSIGTITGPKTASTAFGISITGGTDFFGNPSNGTLTMTTNGGTITPTTVTLANGSASPNITLSQAGAAKTVTATIGSVTATSNPFVVNAGTLNNFLVEAAGGGTIGSQSSGTPFNIQITARDAGGNVVTTFASNVTLTTNVTSINPTSVTAANFVNGVASNQAVTLTGSSATATITATSGSTGTSASFPLIINWYSKPTGSLEQLSSWSSNSNGVGGTSPSNFTNANQIFHIQNTTSATITAANWSVSGTNSRVIIGDGINPTEFILPDNATNGTYFSGSAPIDVAAKGTFTLKDGQYPTLGTLDVNSTVNYNRTANTATQAIASTTYGNIIIAAGTGFATSLDGDIVVNGNLTLNTGGTFTPNNDINIKGNWISTAGTYTGTGSTTTFSGASAQTISGLPITFTTLIINGAGVTQDAATATVSVSTALTLTSGVYTTGAGVLSLTSTSGTAVTRTSGWVNGNFRKSIPTSGTTLSRTFEIGDASNYTPVTISFASVTTAGTLTASTTAGDHPQIASSGI